MMGKQCVMTGYLWWEDLKRLGLALKCLWWEQEKGCQCQQQSWAVEFWEPLFV